MEVVELDGFQILPAIIEPSRKIPEDWTSLTILLKFVGGIGDAIIGIGSVAPILKRKECKIIVSTMEHQRRLILTMSGVDEWIRPQTAHQNLDKVDVFIEFAGSLNNSKELLAEDYYTLVSKKIGFNVVPGDFNFIAVPKRKDNKCIVGLHPGASNPNRRWLNERWEDLAYELVARGFYVAWLGTKDEFGFSDKFIEKLSDVDEDLVYQARYLAGCSYFIGTDSSFAHIAGVLGVKGAVLFGNTSPEHVIARYIKLKGVSAFDRLKLQPTRKLKVNDDISLRCMAAIEVKDVLDAIDCTDLEQELVVRNSIPSKKWKVGVVSNTLFGDEIEKFLWSFCDVTRLSNVPVVGSEFEILIIENNNGGCVVKTKNQAVRVSKTTNFENIRRAMREVFLKAE